MHFLVVTQPFRGTKWICGLENVHLAPDAPEELPERDSRDSWGAKPSWKVPAAAPNVAVQKYQKRLFEVKADDI